MSKINLNCVRGFRTSDVLCRYSMVNSEHIVGVVDINRLESNSNEHRIGFRVYFPESDNGFPTLAM